MNSYAELLKCAVAILVSGYIYVLFGMIVMKKQEISLTATLLLGFFVYFALFQFFGSSDGADETFFT